MQSIEGALSAFWSISSLYNQAVDGEEVLNTMGAWLSEQHMNGKRIFRLLERLEPEDAKSFVT
jgi:hypothetical protein